MNIGNPSNPLRMTEGNPLLDYFIANADRCIHKWVDYFEIYHRAFSRYRGQPITFVEIGVQNGGSTRMWQQYFGPQAKIIGVDIDPACKAMEKEGFEIWIGDQSDPKFWQEFTKKNPSVDIILDDGGHTMQQQIVTFNALFPILTNGGTYLCEDTHTSYFPRHGGGYKRAGTFIEHMKKMVDEMHAWYFAPLDTLSRAYIAHHLHSIAFFDSIVVLEKRKRNPPMAIARGSDGHINNPALMTYAHMRRAFGVPDAAPEATSSSGEHDK